MSTNNRNYIIYGFNLLDLNSEESECLQELRENGHNPSTENSTTFIKCADGRLSHLGIIISVSKDDLLGGFNMFPKEIKKTKKLKKLIKKLKKQYNFLESRKAKFYSLSYYF